MMLKRSPRGHELETETVINHRRAARSQRDAPPVDPGDMLALGRRAMSEPGLVCHPGDRLGDLAALQGFEQIARERALLPMSPYQPFSDEMVEAAIHGISYLDAKPAFA